MPRSRLAWNVVWCLALIAVIGTMCLVARLFIGVPYTWLRPVAQSNISRILPVAHEGSSAAAERRMKCSGVRCAAYGLRGRGTNSREQAPPLGPSRSVGIMCSYYGSTSREIDGWLQTITREDEGHVYMCDLYRG